MAEHVDDQEARRRSVERMRQQAAKGHAPVAQRSNGHAPAAEQNWAQIIAASEVRYERQLGVLREQVAELVAKKSAEIIVADDLSEKAISSLTRGLAKSIAPFVKDCIREAMATRDARIGELENVVRALVQSGADSKRSVATIPYGDADYKSSGRFVHAVGGRVSLGHE